MYSVYALVDPRDEAIRYIGMSKNVWRRYAMHLLIPAKTTTAKNAWIEELRKVDLSPLLTILETVETEEVATEREVHWIKHYLNLNVPLINMSKTGKEFPNRKRPTKLSLPMEMPDEKYFTVEEIAEASGVSTDTIHRLIRRKQLIAYRIGGMYRIATDDLQAYLDTQRTDKSEES